MLTVTPLTAFNDNYIWALQTSQNHGAYVVDPGDANVVIDFLKTNQLPLLGVLITHHHHDHTGGIAQLLQHYGIDTPVYGPQIENINGVNQPVSATKSVLLKNIDLNAEIIEVPGHTLGHVAYLIDNILFCGDTLFSAGCGRLFEGTATQMQQSLALLSDLPESTKVYCTHEYTLANLAFANVVEPNNAELIRYTQQAQQLRANKKPTLPSSIGVEKAINPFLRTHTQVLQKTISEQFQQPINNSAKTFALLRKWKDNF
ncbi:hydroxyacylglutathione hydrolase [Shewanella youngdeokensis]|uniref:Hydroxyacylglutathione hydrolase n=1 Tax=Shewanella youngdeokensis TaxID=2999068 RepID=A0ABZ0K2E5_9GAMM|nr:hydroxyacylglutathione hydrolase [Shewanella sp. DAU334]